MKKTICLSLFYLICSASVYSATSTGNLSVIANVVSNCHVNTTASSPTPTTALLDFGTISSLSSNVDAQTSGSAGSGISVLCSNGTSWAITVGAGNNVTGTQRRMIGGSHSEYLPYDLYSDSGRSSSININGNLATGTGNGTQQFITLYGRIPAGTTLPAADSYSDMVTLTTTY